MESFMHSVNHSFSHSFSHFTDDAFSGGRWSRRCAAVANNSQMSVARSQPGLFLPLAPCPLGARWGLCSVSPRRGPRKLKQPQPEAVLVITADG